MQILGDLWVFPSTSVTTPPLLISWHQSDHTTPISICLLVLFLQDSRSKLWRLMHVFHAVSSALPLTWYELTCHLSLLSLVVSVVWGSP